jgi:hypothetical protein
MRDGRVRLQEARGAACSFHQRTQLPRQGFVRIWAWGQRSTALSGTSSRHRLPLIVRRSPRSLGASPLRRNATATRYWLGTELIGHGDQIVRRCSTLPA